MNLARIRIPMILLGVLIGVLSFFVDLGPFILVALFLAVGGLALLFLPLRKAPCPPIEVASPVQGRWLAVNSPADRVPSHGTHAYGQTYAVDLVHWPEGSGEWKAVQRGALTRPARHFPAYGQPILAPADGTVVRARDFWRDHRSRNSPLALVYLMAEANVRELVGPGGVLGNHVILDIGDGVYALFAHLKRGSVRVRPGERVKRGDRLAECGNSGNSSEPHLHFQLMDHRRPAIAQGLPFALAGHGVPSKSRPLAAP